jgi:hypothetical protein
VWSKADPHETSPLIPKSDGNGQASTETPHNPKAKLKSDAASSTVVVTHHGDSSKRARPKTSELLVDRGPLPGLTDLDSEPENSPSQVVRRVTRKHKRALVVKSDSEPESSVRPTPADKKNDHKAESKPSSKSVRVEGLGMPVRVQLSRSLQ